MKKIKLSEIPKQDPFIMPEGYLEQLPQRIQEKVQQRPQSSWADPKSLWFFPRLQLAFSVLVLLVVSLLFLRQPGKQETDPQLLLYEASQQEIVTYLNNNTNLTVQELALEGDWEQSELMTSELGSKDVLEDEIMNNIDLYTAEELW
ncbi:hypothetical protein D770_03375 [Flammeovirgaceae bacterium 311]|nr:hypothetical protein D770_03375 [Flammeovirgaceae bacterium 311]